MSEWGTSVGRDGKIYLHFPVEVDKESLTTFMESLRKQRTLIEAAPNLLAALDGLLGYVDGVFFMNGWETNFQPAVINARLALAKARGE